MNTKAGTTLEKDAAALCAAGRALVTAGMSPGTSGNISIKRSDCLLVSPTGFRLDAIQPQDVAVVDLQGGHVSGALPSKEVPLHLAMYRRNASASAVVHVHSAWAVAASCLAPWSATSALPPLTPYFVMRVGQVPLAPYAPPGSAELAASIETLPMRFHAALMAHHGSLCAGDSLAQALERATEVEEASRLRVSLANLPANELPRVTVQELARQYGSIWD